MEALAEYVTKQQAQVHRKYKTVLVEEACSKIVSKGTVTADFLLKEASAKSHPLNEFFEWDNTVAGDKWRRAQAMAMIISTRYVCYLKSGKGKAKDVFAEAEKAVQVRRFLPSHDGTGFRDREVVLSDDESRKGVIERKISVLRSWCCSVVDIEELKAIRKAIMSVVD